MIYIHLKFCFVTQKFQTCALVKVLSGRIIKISLFGPREEVKKKLFEIFLADVKFQKKVC